MILSRREWHVFKELTVRGVNLRKLIGKVHNQEVAIEYEKRGDAIMCFLHTREETHYGYAIPIKREKNVNDRVGRMIALTRAVVDWNNSQRENSKVLLSSQEIENVVRGEQTE